MIKNLPNITPFVAYCLVLAMPALLRAADPNAPIDESAYKSPITIACVGDSITHGSGTIPGNSYPDQFQLMLGKSSAVKNFGVSGATLLNHGNKPYQKEKLCVDAFASKPDVVVIMLGTNDSKPDNFKLFADFSADYKDLITKFQKLDSHPRIWIALPPPVPGKGNYGINEENVTTELPLIQTIAKESNTGLIDIHAAMLSHSDLLPDNVHPNADGYTLLAKTVYQSLTGKPYEGARTVIEPPATNPATTHPTPAASDGAGH